MVVHIVLFRPKPDISESNRQAMFDALRVAATEIASIKRFNVGARLTHGSAYEKLMAEDYPHAAVLEFEELEGLKAYLEHPKHARLGELFYMLSEASLIYDYEMTPAALAPLQPK
jgi:hypothetical protein